MSLKVIAILACHNRREETIQCLDSYKAAALMAGISPAAVLMDDGSTDGTSEAIAELFPWVEIIVSDGSLYWNGGMRVVFGRAMEIGADYYLWLNDDTTLIADALQRLLAIAEKRPLCLLVGSVQDPETKARTYGGLQKVSKLRPLKLNAIEPDKRDVRRCDTFNGNCVLIPKCVVDQVGNLSEEFTHAIGDVDYGLRAKKLGFDSLVAPGFYGKCFRNPPPACFDKRNNLFHRIKILNSPKGLPPIEWMVYTRRHAPYVWPLYILKLYIRLVFP
jgi:GT2 family glycosyltransferase